MASTSEIVRYTNHLLDIGKFKDYCPNGLQVEGRSEVGHIVSGVTASQALLEKAIEADADMVLVHHGYFWRSEDPAITGIKRRRVQLLLQADINLLAYHLPLDAHPVYGNNAQLAHKLGITMLGTLDSAELVMYGQLQKPLSADAFAQHLSTQFSRDALHISGGKQLISSVAWCSGGAQNYFEHAIAAGVDAYITGEVSEQNYHLAKECGVDFFAAGHHATERYGVQALGEHLSNHFAIKHTFVDIPNPV
ncbi:MAG: Nif3-like dinuclear metal center hexameric protein [Gammaproteobacteria bacterium]|nr:Nif3-like dinuclear metal center hexameric protein [Gammaproteobacteria bacterium]